MKFAPYSYSRISTYQSCPLKFKFKYIDKVKVPFVYSEALIKGGCLHHILEHFPAKSTHKHQAKYQDVADNFINSKTGQELLIRDSHRELDIGLTKDLETCEYSSKDAMFRGSVDYFTFKDDYLWIVDYKSGKSKELKWQSFDQNMWYALWFFQKYTKLDKIKITYQYIEHTDYDNSVIMERQYIDTYKLSLLDNISKIESDSEFKLKEGPLCNYCDFINICEK